MGVAKGIYLVVFALLALMLDLNEAGEYKLTQEEVGSWYVAATVR